MTLVRKALEILRVVWSDRRQPCTTTGQRAAPPGQMPGNDTTCTPGLRPSPGSTGNEAIQPGKQQRTLARALDHQETPRGAPERHAALDRAPAATRPAPHPHPRPQSLPHLRSRGLAARAVRLAARPVDRLHRHAPRAPPFAPVRGSSQTYGISGRPDSNRGPRRPERRALPGCATPRRRLEYPTTANLAR
jgi:hypothetical protein